MKNLHSTDELARLLKEWEHDLLVSAFFYTDEATANNLSDKTAQMATPAARTQAAILREAARKDSPSLPPATNTAD